MDPQCMTSSSSFILRIHRISHGFTVYPTKARIHLTNKRVFFKFNNNYGSDCQWRKKEETLLTRRIHTTKSKREQLEGKEEAAAAEIIGKKGTIAGAVALIVGTSIGSGILALPQKASPAGILPSSISMIICWGFLVIEALLLVEVNVGLRRKNKRKKEEESELDVISIRTMAQETLGDWGGTLATVTYVFLGYTTMIADSSKSGEILFHLINFPESVSAFIFTAIFTLLISVGGTRATDQVNQWLTASMIGLLLAIEALAAAFGGWSGLGGNGDWGKVPATIPVMIFSLVYHDLAPGKLDFEAPSSDFPGNMELMSLGLCFFTAFLAVLCAYLDGDLTRLRASVLLGSLVPLFALLFWDAIALGLSAQANQITDPVELLMRVSWSGVPFMVQAFSLLAVGTSLIGTLLGFSEFFKEQLKKLHWCSLSQQRSDKHNDQTNWWGRNKINFTAMAMAVTPSLLVSTTIPDAYSEATDIAGGYCMTVLYGVLPPAMAWAMHGKEGDDPDHKALSGKKPALVVLGLFAFGIVLEQILQDLGPVWCSFQTVPNSFSFFTLFMSHKFKFPS